jgi:signal transduction histidine kinase/ActR/RegA family two-component response regulator
MATSELTAGADPGTAQLHVLINSHADGILVVTPDDGIEFVNPAAEALLGRPARQLVGQSFGLPTALQEPLEVDLVRPDGVPKVAEMRAVPIQWSGRPAFLVSLRDVTDSKRMRLENAALLEQERASRAAAEAAERRAAFLAEASKRLTASLDAETALADVARLAVPTLADVCAVHLLESDGSVRLLTLTDGRTGVPEEVQRRADPLNRDADRGVPKVLRTGQTEFVPQVTDEAARALGWRSTWVVPMAVSGRTLGTLAFATADPKRTVGPAEVALAEELGRRAATALDHARLYRRLEESDRRRNEFLAMLAHELRNPLAPVRNALYLMQRSPADANSVAWARDVIARQVGQMAQLIDGLLEVSRITRGKVQLHKETIGVGGLVARVVETVRPLMEARRHQITVELPLEPLRAEADPLRLEQMLVNLLDNAAKYTPPGGRVAVGVERAGDAAVIRVTDNGDGIAPEVLPRVFELFEQADRTLDRSQGGLGLGLTLVKKLAEMHGGDATARSPGLGRGSTFTIRIPALPAAAAGTPAAEDGDAAHGRTVLVVDDNRDLAESLAMVLRLWGHDVSVAYDGAAALEAARTHPPEVILLDIGLPVLDGYQVARRLRQERGLERARIVAITGYGREEDRQKAREAGFDVHLVKPVDPKDLQEILTDDVPEAKAS